MARWDFLRSGAASAQLQFLSNMQAMSFGRSALVSPGVWLLLRCLIAAYFLASLAYSLYVQPRASLKYYPTEITYWMLALEAVYAVCMLWVTIIYSRTTNSSFSNLSAFTKSLVYLTWFALNVVGPGCLVVSAIYWGFLYKGGLPSHNTINVHAVNSVVIMLDVFLSAAPFRLLHVWCAEVFGAAYVVFLTIYFLVGHEKVYNVVNFHHPIASTYFLLATFIIAIPTACVITRLVKHLGQSFAAPEAEEGSEVEFRSRAADSYNQQPAYNAWTGADRV